MEDFQVQDHSNILLYNSFKHIKQYCKKNYPYESGGFIKRDYSLIYVKSIIKDMLNFYPEPVFYNYLRKPDLLKYTFHSHLDCPLPSDNDIFFVKNYDIPIIIYSLNRNIFLSVNIIDEKINTTWYIEEAGLWTIKC